MNTINDYDSTLEVLLKRWNIKFLKIKFWMLFPIFDKPNTRKLIILDKILVNNSLWNRLVAYVNSSFVLCFKAA